MLGRVRGGIPFPDVTARMQPSDSLPPLATAPVPLAGGLPRCGRFFCASAADDTCARQRVVRRRRVTGSPRNRGFVEERRGPPRLRGRPLRACHGRTPRRIPAPLAQKNSRRGWLLPSGKTGPSASGKAIGFGAACPMAHMLACLRFAEAISDAVARLATGSGGLTLGRAGFAPAGRQTTFHGGIVSSSPN